MANRSKVFTIGVVILLLAVAVVGVVLLNGMGKGTNYTNVSSVRLQVLGNANEDDTIDQRDIDLIKDVIDGKEEKGNLTDANNDGKIDNGDIDAVKKIIDGEETILYYIDCDNQIASVHTPVNSMLVAYSNNAEMVRVLNATDRVIGVDDFILTYPDYFPEFQDKPSAGSRLSFNVEAILKIHPDIVFTGTRQWYTPGLEGMLKANGTDIDVVRLPSWEYNLVGAGILTLGYILGQQDEAYAYLEWHDGIMDNVKTTLDSIPENEKLRVFVDRPGSTSVGVGSGYAEILELAGGINLAKGLSGTYPKVDPEWVLKQNPEYIIGISFTGGYEGTDTSVLNARVDSIDTDFGPTAAVTSGNVHVMHYDILLGPGYVVGLFYMAKWLYPSYFADLDPQELHQEFVDKFCGGLDYDVSEQGVFVL